MLDVVRANPRHPCIHIQNMRFYRSIFILFSLILLQVSVSAKNEITKLKSVQQKINVVKSNLNQAQHVQVVEKKQLKTTEVNLTKLTKSYQQTQENLHYQQVVLSRLNQNQANYNQQLQKEKQHLFEQVRLAYMLGQQDYTKTLLSQQDPNKIDRMLTYHRYILNSRLDLMDKISGIIHNLQHNKHQIQKQAIVLSRLKFKQQTERTELEKIKNQHSQNIVIAKNTIRDQSRQLSKLLNDQKNLEVIISRLSAQKAYTPPSPSSLQKICDKIVWPTAGKILVHYGSSIEHSSWTWSGLLIAASEGQAVQAIANGRVVFANQLSGYGLLLIIDHGRGYMSLYGYNQQIYKRVGDVVHSGETVASVGHSGDQSQPKLYFAIRHNGSPVNPETWCKKI